MSRNPMKERRVVRIPAVLAMLATVASLAAASPAAADPQPFYAIGKCVNEEQPAEQRPERFDYNCDGTGVMSAITWTSWGADGARGTGTDVSVECKPNCAQGPRLTNPIVVHAWNPLPPNNSKCARGFLFFSDLTIAYPKGAPPWINPGTTWDPGTDFVTVDGMPGVHFSNLSPNCLPY